MKKILLNLFSIILAVSMVFTMAPLSMEKAYADDPVTTTIDGVEYTLNVESGTGIRTATVSGNTNSQQAEVTIPQSVTYENEDYTVTSIGKFAFLECETLKAITIPKDVTSIGNSAFDSCSSLTSVTFAEGSMLSTIGSGVFAGCKSLETITLPEKVTSIESWAFLKCETLNTITIPKDVTSIGNSAFDSCSSLTSVTFAEGSMLLTIGGKVFAGCKSLETITLPENVTSIESWAFNGCEALRSINIPKGVTTIEERTFAGCSSLTSVTFEEGSKLTTIDIGAFYSCKNLRSITIPEKVTNIEESAFNGCANLQSISIPEGVESIGAHAFYGCRQLSTVTIPASVESIGEYAFHWSGLTSVVFAEGSKLTTIAEEMFSDCFSLTTITIPESVKSIEKNAFYGCTELKTVNFGGSKSQWEAITGDGKPTGVTVNYAKDYPVFKTINGVAYVLNEDRTATVTGYTAYLPAEVIIPQSIKYENEDFSVKSIKDYAFMKCSSLKNITIPEGVTSIGNSAFWDSGLTSVTFEEGSKLTTIDAGAFAGCQSLGAITIPEGVTSIKKGAFYSCNSMETITIPESVTSIGENAFFGCTGLTTVNFGGSKSQWEAITGDGKPTGVTVKCMGFQGAKVELSATSFTYNGKAQKPSILKIDGNALAEGTDYTAAWSNASSKSVGTYSITVTGKGQYKDTAKATYQIVPKGTTLKKPKKAKKAVTVKWKKQKAKMPTARISGYQIQLATNNAFTMNTKTVNVKGYKKTSKKVKKLKGKTKYFVRVRTYMKTGGNTYYSPWSKAKSVKTK